MQRGYGICFRRKFVHQQPLLLEVVLEYANLGHVASAYAQPARMHQRQVLEVARPHQHAVNGESALSTQGLRVMLGAFEVT